MSQSADIQPHSLEDILEILRSQALSMPVSSTSSRYLRALTSLESSIMGGRFGYAQAKASPNRPIPSEECAAGLSQGETEGNTARSADTEPSATILRAPLADWLVSLWLSDTPYATASLYLDIISSLYGSAVKANLLPPTKLFSQLKADLKALGPNGWKGGIDDEIFARALRLTKNAALLISDDSIAASLVILSLTRGLSPLRELALLKKQDFALLQQENKVTDNLSFIINNLSLTNARRKYIFDLRQSERTPKQLEKHIAKIVNALFKRARLPQATDPYQTVEALWAYAALRSGIPASQLVSYLGHAPLGLPVLKLSSSSSLSSLSSKESSDADKTCTRIDDNDDNDENADNCKAYTARSADTFKEYFAQVGKIFLENPPRWYAMSLRPGVRFTQVCRRLELLGDRIPQPQLFYPCEEIARAIGKKIVVKQRPFIHSVVFFHAKLTDIGRLFSKIGDLAWCYRQSARPGAPYADISERQFQLFQQTIASFTPDYEVAFTGELELKKNDRVQILGGLFAGHEATFEESKVKGQGSRVKGQGSGVKGQESSIAVSENGKRKTENANASGVVYRLNIVGDNGIEWRINVDSRLLSPSAKSKE